MPEVHQARIKSTTLEIIGLGEMGTSENQSEQLSDHTVLDDLLLRLLSDNMVFLNKVFHCQWNYRLLPDEQMAVVVRQLLFCSELISGKLKLSNGFVPAAMEIYLEMSGIKEELAVLSNIQARKALLKAHEQVLQYIKEFLEDPVMLAHDSQRNLINQLLEAHSLIFINLEPLLQ